VRGAGSVTVALLAAVRVRGIAVLREHGTAQDESFEQGYDCISMQRYWSSLRYFVLRTLFVLADVMNEARLSHLPFWGPSEAIFFLIKRPSG